jgi:Flp pilus assembly pilin Flp
VHDWKENPVYQLFPELLLVQAMLHSARRRAYDLRTREDGASALEWAIIAAVVGAAAVALGIVITQKITEKQTEIGGL